MTDSTSRVIVCKGCCCGKVEKGHPEVPIEELTAAWKIHNLSQHVKLKVSGCLGPCRMHNVSVLEDKGNQIWLGELSGLEHYEAIVEWAQNIAVSSKDTELPQSLVERQFNPNISE